jgi:Kef-type K+ transport system membrane component KefB
MVHLFTLVLQIAVILVVCRVTGSLFRLIRQPRVVGEMFAGILLGPSVLGWLAPRLSAALFPPASLGHLNALSQVGLIIFMFLVGMGINPSELQKQGHTAVLTSHVSISFPFMLAAFLALYLYPRISDESVPFMSFALFMGAAMSITAFPVLARILAEQNMLQSRLGTVAIACAAVDDVTGWCILAYIIAMIRAVNSASSIWLTAGGVVAFALIMIFGVRPLLRRFETTYRRQGALSENPLALMLLLVLASALCTEWLGIHLLFGAFLLGAIMPKEQEFVSYVTERLQPVIVILLLPLFFAFTGLRTSIGLINGPEMWIYFGFILLVATVGKLGGSTLACRLTGMPLRESVGLGALMNTRGLMELVILNIGLDVKVISPALFSMMVMMALVTTFMTSPILGAVAVRKFQKADDPWPQPTTPAYGQKSHL